MSHHKILHLPSLPDIGFAFWDWNWHLRLVVEGGGYFPEGNQTIWVSIRNLSWEDDGQRILIFGGCIIRTVQSVSTPPLTNIRGKLQATKPGSRWTGLIDIERDDQQAPPKKTFATPTLTSVGGC